MNVTNAAHWTVKKPVHTLEVSWSTLSPTFPMDKRISVFCCLASVIKKEVTSVEPGEEGFHLCTAPSHSFPVQY